MTMRLLLLLAGIAIAHQAAALDMGPGSHHAAPGIGRQVRTLTLSGPLSLSNGTLNLHMGSIALDAIINIIQIPNHRGHTYCMSSCFIAGPSNSTMLAAETGSRLVITTPWTPQTKADLRIGVSLTAIPALRPGTIEFRGTLDATAAGGTISIYGTPQTLPIPLVRAASISGTWTARTIPAGTRLLITGSTITLTRTPR